MIMTLNELRVSPRSAVQVMDYPPSAVFGPRLMKNFEFVWLLSGSARWRLQPAELDGVKTEPREYLLRPGELFLAKKGQTDTLLWDSHQVSSHAYVHMDVDISAMPEGLRDAVMDGWPVMRSLQENPLLAGLCSYLLDLARMDDAPARQRSDQMVGLLLDIFINGPLPATTNPQLSEKLRASVDFVKHTWQSGGMRIISLAELAAAGNMSSGHCSRLFSKELGVGPVAALELIRLAHAATLLLRSELSLMQIAHYCGYGDSYHLSHRFVAAYGVPPGKYRKSEEAASGYWPVARAEVLPLWRALGADMALQVGDVSDSPR